MKIYFTLYLIPVVIFALLVFWLALRKDAHRLIFILALSVAVLAVLHPVFALVAVGLVLVTHQLVELKRRERLRGARVVLIAIIIALVTLGIGKYGQRGAIAIWGEGDPIVTHLIMPLGISYFVFRMLQYVFDCMRGVIKENSLLRLAAFMMFIPTFPAGPLETYQGFYEKRTPGFDRQEFYYGLQAHRAGLLQEGLRRRLPLLDLLRQDHHHHRAHGLRPRGRRHVVAARLRDHRVRARLLRPLRLHRPRDRLLAPLRVPHHGELPLSPSGRRT